MHIRFFASEYERTCQECGYSCASAQVNRAPGDTRDFRDDRHGSHQGTRIRPAWWTWPDQFDHSHRWTRRNDGGLPDLREMRRRQLYSAPGPWQLAARSSAIVR